LRQENKSRQGSKSKTMMFLLRAAFWLTVVALLLPTGHSQSAATAPQINAVDAVSAAGAAVSDVTQFCTRQPNACVVGSQAAAAVGQKAQAGAKMLYELLTEHAGSNDAAPTTKTSDRTPMPTARPSHNTLTPADLAPAWRGPEQPKKEAHARRPA
jgi:hypothetical protein